MSWVDELSFIGNQLCYWWFFMELNMLVSIFAFIFGAVIGSFLNVVILRLPSDNSSIAHPASHCPQCSTTLRWFDNIPLLSYAFLLGRCRYCKASILLQYPIVELLMALLSLAVYIRFDLTITAAGYLLFCAALLAIIWIDIYHQIIPDTISLPGIVLGFCFSLITPVLTWQDSLIGLVAGGGSLYLIALFYLLARKQDGMGGGDIKLLGMIGAFLGWQSLLFVVFFSSLTGAIVGIVCIIRQGSDTATRIPFGPFLSMAALVFLFFQEQIFYFFRLYMEGRLTF
jgi:leader peptidase (prepilin peptidase)/N-methyltransferase